MCVVGRPAVDGEMFEARLDRREGAIDQARLVSAPAQPAIEQDDMPRRTADVQAGDDTKNLHAGAAMTAGRNRRDHAASMNICQSRSAALRLPVLECGPEAPDRTRIEAERFEIGAADVTVHLLAQRTAEPGGQRHA